MYKAFIEPDLKTAHIKIQNKFNPFSGFQNPTYILKVTAFILFKRVVLWWFILSATGSIIAAIFSRLLSSCSRQRL